MNVDLITHLEGIVTVSCRNLMGSSQAVLYSGNLHRGRHSLSLDISKLNEGVYFITITSGGHSETYKVVVQ